MFKLTLFVLGSISIFFTSNDPKQFSANIQAQVKAHIPSAIIQETKHIPQKTIAIQHHVNSSAIPFKMEQTKNLISIDQSSNDPISNDFVHILYAVARKEWLKKNIFPVHSACIGNDQDGYALIIGPSGAGKTTTALGLISKYDFKLYSGDKTLVRVDDLGIIHAVAGTSELTTRIDSNIEHLKDTIMNKQKIMDRNTIELHEDKLVSHPTIPIKIIFFIKAYHAINRNIPLNFPNSLFTLYPFFTDQERADTIVGQGKDVISGNIKQKTKQTNIQSLTKGLKQTKVINLTGSLSYVVDQIAEELKK